MCIKALTNAPRILPSITLFLLRIHGSGWFAIFFFSISYVLGCHTAPRTAIATSFSANTLRPDCFIYLCNMHFGSNCHASRIAHTLIIAILTILRTDRIHTLTCSPSLSPSTYNYSSLAYALSNPISYSIAFSFCRSSKPILFFYFRSNVSLRVSFRSPPQRYNRFWNFAMIYKLRSFVIVCLRYGGITAQCTYTNVHTVRGRERKQEYENYSVINRLLWFLFDIECVCECECGHGHAIHCSKSFQPTKPNQPKTIKCLSMHCECRHKPRQLSISI